MPYAVGADDAHACDDDEQQQRRRRRGEEAPYFVHRIII